MSKTNEEVKEKKVRKKAPKVKKVNYNPGDKAARKNLVLIGGAATAIIVISAIIFMTLSSLFSTESYYVLNTNVKAKQQITPEMVEMRETAEGTAPVHALSMEEIQRGGVYSKYPLLAGDVVARSNAGPLSGTPLGIPDDWLVTSFTINSTDAVGGILGKGDYADLLGVKSSDDGGDGGAAQYIFNNLLILEVKFINEELDGEAEGKTVVGEVMHYTVGLPADKVAFLHSALEQYDTIKMIKAPTEVNYTKRNLLNLKDSFRYGPSVGNIDVFEGTDPTFTEIKRDKDGRPINVSEKVEDEDEIEDNDSDSENEDSDLEENEELVEMEEEEILQD